MTFEQALWTCLRKCAWMRGRASRSEYWLFTLAGFLMSFMALVFDVVLFAMGMSPGLVSAAITVLLFLPQAGVAVRRFQDTGRSALHLFSPVPWLAGGIAVGALLGQSLGRTASILSGLVMLPGLVVPTIRLALPSDAGPNRYGPSPARAFP